MTRIGVIGAGAWGTALAASAAQAGCEVVLWMRSAKQAETINRTRRNEKRLPGVDLPAGIVATSQAADVGDCQAVLAATPAQAMRQVMTTFADVLKAETPVIICAKGIEQQTGKLMSEVIDETCPQVQALVLSGPSFAADMARGLPCAVVLAATTIEQAKPLASLLGHGALRIYTSDDMTGVQIGGAAKNVLAIACGICQGKGLGESARAALTTRAFAELARLGRVLGAREQTLAGLSGLGDLILTCASLKSRNFSLGHALGEGRALKDILAGRTAVSEGVHTAPVVVDMARANGVEVPVCEAVAAIVAGRSTPDAEIARLMSRPQRAEID